MALRDSILNIVIRARNLAARPLDRFKRDLKDIESTAGRSDNKLAKLTRRVLGLAGAAIGLHTITRAFQAMLSTGDQFERLGVQMEAIMGSVQEGQRATAWIKDFAKNTPLQLADVTEAFTTLRNFGIDPTNGSLQAITDLNSKLGGGQERLIGIARALGQAWGKQKLQGEEILQLVDRGVPIWDLLAQVTGKNVAELQELSSAGALGRDVIQKLMDTIGEQSAGAAAKNMTLLSGYVSNLKDEWALFLNEIAQAGALDYAKDALRGLLQSIQEMKQSGRLQELAQSISAAFISIGDAIRGTITLVRDFSTQLTILGAAWAATKVAGWSAAILAAGSAFATRLAPAVTTVNGGLKAMGAAFRALPWLAVLVEVGKLTQAYIELRRVQGLQAEGAQQEAFNAEKRAEILRRISDALGIAVTSEEQLNQIVREGLAVRNEETGAFELTAKGAAKYGKALQDATVAARSARENAEALSPIYRELGAAMAAAESQGGTLGDTIAAMAEKAIASGSPGIQALAIKLRELEQSGKATRTELQDGLGKALLALKEEDKVAFAKVLTQAMKDIDAQGGNAAVRMEYMATILRGQLHLAAERAGLSLRAMLTGIDDDTGTALKRMEELEAATKGVGLTAEETAKIVAGGIGKIIESIDSTEEIDAVTEALTTMASEGKISTADLNEALGQIAEKAKEIEAAAGGAGDALTNSLDAAGEAADRAEDAAGRAEGVAHAMADAYQAAQARVLDLSDAALVAFNRLQNINAIDTSPAVGSIDAMRAAVIAAHDRINDLAFADFGDFIGVRTFMVETARNAAEVEAAFFNQKVALEDLLQQYNEGRISLSSFTARAEDLKRNMDLLDDTSLDNLQSAIDQANESLARLRDTARDTVDSLRTELDRLQGNTEAIEKRQYEQRRRELEEQLSLTQRARDQEATRDAQEALDIAEDIYRIKLATIRDERLAREQQEARDKVVDGRTQRDSAPQPQLQPGSTITLKLGTTSVDVQTDNPGALLEILQQAGLRTA